VFAIVAATFPLTKVAKRMSKYVLEKQQQFGKMKKIWQNNKIDLEVGMLNLFFKHSKFICNYSNFI